jgi:hypothetical protein
MAVSLFLTKLNDYGLENNYFTVCEMKNLDKTCCNTSNIEVIDFDKTKEILCHEQNLQQYKSCDALKILVDKKRIDFIEMKGLSNYLNPKFPNKNNFDKNSDINTQIKNRVENFNLVQKIDDSLLILKLLIQKQNFVLTNDEKQIFKSILKNFIIVTDIDLSKNGLEFIVATLDILSENSSSIEQIALNIFNEEVENTEFLNIYNIQKPIPMICETFSNFYL